MGLENFAKKASAAGVSGVLTVDLPCEEAQEYRKNLKENGLDTVFLASPTTAPDRLKAISDASTGFVYYVSRTGVTGVQSEVSQTLSSEIEQLREKVDQPLVIGFGISNAEQARKVGNLGDGVVIGSAIVKMIEAGSDSQAVASKIRDFARSIKSAL